MEISASTAYQKQIQNNNAQEIARAAELSPTSLTEFLRRNVVEVILAQSDRIVIAPSAIVEEEGSVGYLPPPARRLQAQEYLAGESVTQRKVYEREIHSDDNPRPQVDSLNLHLIVEVTPQTAANPEEVFNTSAIIADLFRLDGFQPGENSLDDQQVPLVASRSMKLHLIRRNILGQYSYDMLDINNNEQLQQSINTYQAKVNESLDYDYTLDSTEDSLAQTLLSAEISSQIDQSRGNVNVPIIIYPKHLLSYSLRSPVYQEHRVRGKTIEIDPELKIPVFKIMSDGERNGSVNGIIEEVEK